MQITSATSLDLALLTHVLDRLGTDIAQSLHRLAEQARLAVRSYLGLRLSTGGEPPFILTALEDGAAPKDVRSSLLVPLAHGGRGEIAAGAVPGPALVLYAARPGAFVDLAADLSWLNGVDLSGYILDQHLPTGAPALDEPTVDAASVVDQAIGVLLARGHLPEQALEELNARAADQGTDRCAAAAQILSTLATADLRDEAS